MNDAADNIGRDFKDAFKLLGTSPKALLTIRKPEDAENRREAAKNKINTAMAHFKSGSKEYGQLLALSGKLTAYYNGKLIVWPLMEAADAFKKKVVSAKSENEVKSAASDLDNAASTTETKWQGWRRVRKS
jgi:hypothetical protein